MVRLCRASNRARPRRQADDLGVEDGGAFDPRRFLDDARIALGPVGGVHGVEPHPPVADVDLQPIAVVLEFVRPAGTARRLLGDGRTARMDEGGRRVIRPAARVTPQHIANIGHGKWGRNRGCAMSMRRLAKSIMCSLAKRIASWPSAWGGPSRTSLLPLSIVRRGPSAPECVPCPIRTSL